jgi:3-deoxy-D-manno-octulosonic-acid transferase
MSAAAVLFAGWRALGWALTPLIHLWIKRRRRSGREHETRWPERFGQTTLARPDGFLVWAHAASMGESLAILPLLERLRAERPGVSFLMTTGTVTSAALMAERLPAGCLHQFAPIDLPGAVDRFLDHWRPDLALWTESELWPTTLNGLKRRGAPVVLLNGRLSPRSFARWRRAPLMARALLGCFDQVLARGPEDSGRYAALGLSAPTVGDLKTAAPPLPVDEAELARLRALIGNSPLFLASSLHPGEEDAVAAVHQALLADHPDLITIIVPRHPIRGPEWADKLSAGRRAAGADPARGGIYVADTMGELGLWYRLAPFAFIGFSLSSDGGGQNPLEAARLGCGVVIGPGVKNFTEAVEALARGGGVLRVTDADDLTSAIRRLLSDGQLRESLRLGAAHAARAEAAVLDRVTAALAVYLPGR